MDSNTDKGRDADRAKAVTAALAATGPLPECDDLNEPKFKSHVRVDASLSVQHSVAESLKDTGRLYQAFPLQPDEKQKGPKAYAMGAHTKSVAIPPRDLMDIISDTNIDGQLVKQTLEGQEPNNMRTLPLYYPTETLLHQVTFALFQFQLVVNALLSIFHALSLEVQHQVGDGQTKAVVTFCKCIDGTQFRVQLWKKEHGVSDETACLVEVQRTAGDQILFSQLVQRVLNAVEEAVRPSVKTQSPSNIADLTTERLLYDMVNLHDSQRVWDSFQQQVEGLGQTDATSIASVMEPYATLVMSNVCEQIHSGLTALKIMTDARESGLTTASIVSRHLICQCSSKASQAIIFLALDGNWPKSVAMEANDMRRHVAMRKQYSYLSLTIVAQALSVAGKADIDSFLMQTSALELHVVQSLMRDMGTAHNAPHTAYLATHILACLCRAQPSIRDAVVDHEPYTKSVQMAHHVGMGSHDALAQACGRLLSLLAIQVDDMNE